MRASALLRRRTADPGKPEPPCLILPGTEHDSRRGGTAMMEAGQRWSGGGGNLDGIVNLSDGVFAIAITLLVLDIRVPEIPERTVATELPGELFALWPRYLGYLLSFGGISMFWVVHHSIFRGMRSYDRGLVWLNFLFLMFVAFVPFPTSLLGEYGNHQLPVAVYAATLAVGRLLLTAIQWYSVRHDRLLDEAQDPATVRFLLIRGLTIPAIYLLTIVISFFSVQAATLSWVILIVVDSVILRIRLSH